MKVAVIGITGKSLTFNVIKALQGDDNCSLEMVLLRRPAKKLVKKEKPIFYFIKYFHDYGFSYVVKRLLKGLEKKKPINIGKFCSANQIQYFENPNINSQEMVDALKQAQIDVIVLAGSSIVKEEIFIQSKLYTINIHRSLLPRYAGLAAIFWAMYHNEKEIGATVHTVNKGIDSGEIIVQRRKEVGIKDTVSTLTDWYLNEAPHMILEALSIISQPGHRFTTQDFSQRSYFSRPTQDQVKELIKRNKY